MNEFLGHGRIIGGVVTTPDLDAALEDYHGRLGLNVVERGELAADLAASWNCYASAGARTATLQPQSGAHCFIRLIEQAVPKDFRPVQTFGWAAYELTVQDVYGWPGRLAGSGFDIVGPPKEIAGLPYFVPMQVTGREMIYLNEVRENTPSSDLPKAQSLTDFIFICILATPDREANLKWLQDNIGLDIGGTYTLEYTMINKAFGLPEGIQSSITMIQKDRLPIIEVDDYPDAATVRPRVAGHLPPGNALVTLAVHSLAAIKVEFIEPPAVRGGAIYAGKRSAAVVGMAGELLELVEIG
jgi:catechol 2,3-dioxygenase-like lactoylglutathione lyase family enzyme